jgi:hypothetical protein
METKRYPTKTERMAVVSKLRDIIFADPNKSGIPNAIMNQALDYYEMTTKKRIPLADYDTAKNFAEENTKKYLDHAE